LPSQLACAGSATPVHGMPQPHVGGVSSTQLPVSGSRAWKLATAPPPGPPLLTAHGGGGGGGSFQ
jgi:hypothetical protein